MFEPCIDYIKTTRGEKCVYEMIRPYVHCRWLKKGPYGEVGANGVANTAFHPNDGVLILECGYQRNGSDYVPDEPGCMRASAVHDAWCRAMSKGQIPNTRKNRNCGVREYIAICRNDGLGLWNRRVRNGAMWGYRVVKYSIRWLFRDRRDRAE